MLARTKGEEGRRSRAANKKKRQRKQINQKRVKKAINKTSIDGDSKAICRVRVSREGEELRRKGRRLSKAKGARCNPVTGKSPNEYRGDAAVAAVAAAVFRLPSRSSCLLYAFLPLSFSPSLPSFRVCVAFSFCKFVLLVPFGFISASFVLQLANFNGEWQKQVSFAPLRGGGEGGEQRSTGRDTQSYGVDKKVRVKRVCRLHKFEL